MVIELAVLCYLNYARSYIRLHSPVKLEKNLIGNPSDPAGDLEHVLPILLHVEVKVPVGFDYHLDGRKFACPN